MLFVHYKTAMLFAGLNQSEWSWRNVLFSMFIKYAIFPTRTQAKLDSVAKELEAFGVNVKTIAVDFVQDEARQYKLLIASEIEG